MPKENQTYTIGITDELLDLLQQDIYTDAHEYTDRVKRVKELVMDITTQPLALATEKHLTAALDSLSTLIEYLREAHDSDLQDDHGGDGPDDCTYCSALLEADSIQREALNLEPRPVAGCYNCGVVRPIVTDEGERYCFLCGSTDVCKSLAAQRRFPKREKETKPVKAEG